MKKLLIAILSFCVVGILYAETELVVPESFYNGTTTQLKAPSEQEPTISSTPDIKDVKEVITGVGTHRFRILLPNGENDEVPVKVTVNIANEGDSISILSIKLMVMSMKFSVQFKNRYSYAPKSLIVDLYDDEGKIILYYSAENSYGGTVSNSLSRFIVKSNGNYKIER